MKILHLCLACFYIDGYNYQENVLPRLNKEDGHEVKIIASTETFVDNQTLGYVEPAEYVTEYGVPIVRLPYVKIGPMFSTVKLRKYMGLYDQIAKFAPDVIMSHDLAYWSVKDVVRYKKEHPEVKLYADTHTAEYNSGTNWLSMHVLHRGFYRHLTKKVLPYLEKFFYIGAGERDFALKHYKVPAELMEFYPLGGNLFSVEEYAEKRARRRAELELAEGELLFVHSGKMDALKRTADLLRAFAAVPDLKAKFAVIGSLPDETKDEITALIEADLRVTYLGWRSSQDLLEYLCAADLYCQPGSVSATMQNAICCNCPILLYPHEAYVNDYEYGNILWAKSEQDMADAFARIEKGEVDLEKLRIGSKRCAEELLDYRKLAARLYQ